MPLDVPSDGRVPVAIAEAPRAKVRTAWLPTCAMIRTRAVELGQRRSLMVTSVSLTIGIPVLFLGIRLLLHAFIPHSFGPAGGSGIFDALVASVLYVFAFIVAAFIGATAACGDLQDGMFRQLVVTGRSRVSLYLARIPAGLAIVVPMVAVAFGVICFVCATYAPRTFDFQGTTVPLGLSKSAYQSWAAEHRNLVICDFPYNGPCPGNESQLTAPLSQAAAEGEAAQNYPTYSVTYVAPPVGLMVRTGLWLELEVAVALTFGLGFASLVGQRTLPIVLMIVYELMFKPFLLRLRIPYAINLQRSLVELAVAHLEPGGVGWAYGAMNGPGMVRDSASLVPESRLVAVAVVLAWLAGWTVLGAWRMAGREA